MPKNESSLDNLNSMVVECSEKALLKARFLQTQNFLEIFTNNPFGKLPEQAQIKKALLQGSSKVYLVSLCKRLLITIMLK